MCWGPHRTRDSRGSNQVFFSSALPPAHHPHSQSRNRLLPAWPRGWGLWCPCMQWRWGLFSPHSQL